MKDQIRPAVVSLLAFTVILGLVYPLLMTGIAHALFSHQATGSLIHDKNGKVVGSELIGQPFDNPAYFFSRPTAQANYNASYSTGSNLGPTAFVDNEGNLGPNPALRKAVQDRIDALRALDPGNTAPVPIDLVTTSSSGLDPHISPAAAYYQAGRIARLRGQSKDDIDQMIASHTEGRTLGVLGEPRVNVLGLNRALDERFGPVPDR
ncbi:MAG: potassium-transporting ATPase subunit KdpC [Kofleriaceae bacterium]|nr:potassium-transporting ATPase subunit KdpC [Kofleriaceae bacterium]